MAEDRRQPVGADTAVEASVAIRLLGPFELVVEGRRIDAVRTPRLESLVAYLTLRRKNAISRNEIAFAMWPDSSDAQALTNLRRELHSLRRAIGNADRILRAEHRTIEWLSGPQTALDVADFEAACERGQDGDIPALSEAVRLYRGDLLPACYDEWISPERDRLRASFLETLEALAGRLEERREYGEALRHLRRLVQVDPINERGYQAIIRIASVTANRAAGLQAYHACATSLRRELGVEPSADTREAYERLLALDRSEARPASATQVRASGHAAAAGATLARDRLVGRISEWAVFIDAWRRTTRSGPELLFVTGEPGIGKTRLIEEQLRWAGGQGYAAVYARSYAAEGGLAYGPVADWLRASPVRGELGRLAPVWQTEISRLVPELRIEHEDLPAPEPMVEGWQRQRLFEALVNALRLIPTPMLLALDDAHWADQDTLEWLHYLLRADPLPPALVVLGSRSGEHQLNPAVSRLLAALRGLNRVTELELAPLSESETAELAEAAAERSLDAATRSGVFRETEGLPLFVVEIARSGLPLASGNGDDRGGSGRRPLPPRVQAVIAARLDQLSPPARELAEVAAAVGRDFTFDLLATAGDLEEDELARALDELWRRQIVRDIKPDVYDLRHDRIREVAYSLTSPVRRRLHHRRIAQALELLHGGELDPVAAQLGGHYEAAGMSNEAVRSYERAGRVAVGMSANGEAVRHLNNALAILRGLPASRERDERELAILLALPGPLNATLAFSSPDLETVLARIRALGGALGRREDEVGALTAMSSVYFVRGEFRRSLEVADAGIALMKPGSEYRSAGHLGRGWPLLGLGEIAVAIQEFEAALTTYKAGRSRPFLFGFDAATFAAAHLSHALWLSGRSSEAVARSEEAIERATHWANPHLQAMTHAFAAIVHQFRGATADMQRHAGDAIELCREYELAYYGEWGEIIAAWAERNDPAADGASRIERALSSLRSMRAETRRPYYLALLADVHLAQGQVDRARAVLGAALATTSANDDRWWLPEIHRLLGGLDPGPEGEGEVRRALDVARGQGSRALALRAATDLARRSAAFHPILAEVLGEMPDRSMNPDRLAAEELLGETSGAR